MLYPSHEPLGRRGAQSTLPKVNHPVNRYFNVILGETPVTQGSG